MNLKYKKMIRLMLKKEEETVREFCPPEPESKRRIAAQEGWSLYILECRDGSYYTGITSDLERRVKMHGEGKASRYTRTRRPVRLIYQEMCASRAQALVRECTVKAFSKKKKAALIFSNDPPRAAR